MTLKALMTADISSVLLNTDEFATSQSRYTPVGGKPRLIDTIETPTEVLDENGMVIASREALLVECAEDATTGIDNPQVGDEYRPAGGDDTFPYKATGSVRERGDGWIIVEFERHRPVQAGGEQPIGTR